MPDNKLALNSAVIINKAALNDLLALLREDGFEIVGPRVEHKVIAYGVLETIEDLPYGYASIVDKGKYRLVQTANQQHFSALPGSQNLKKYLYPAKTDLFFVEQKNGRWEKEAAVRNQDRYALIGVRACELAGLEILDKVLIREDFTDSDYGYRRSNLFIVSVNCAQPGGNCFCVSMGTGPECKQGYDLNITELDGVFLVDIGSHAGLSFIEKIEWRLAGGFHLQAAQRVIDNASKSMGREVKDLDTVPDLLLEHLEDPIWVEISEDCLSCGSCTMVCPTCFCWDVNDHVHITTEKTSRQRVWDSCFNPGYSSIAGGNTRPSTKARYRQWLTHKYGNWKIQFGTLGCVGCGRCISWCPAGIDVTEQIAAFQEAFLS